MKKITALILAVCLLFLTGCTFSIDNNSFKFTNENFPKMGGSPTAAELGKAITATALGVKRSDAEAIVGFGSTTADSYKALCDGKLDILIAYEPDAQTEKYINKSGKVLEMSPVATDALVFICSEKNSADSLTLNQISGIYTGRIKNWSEVGGSDGEILPYQCKKGSPEQELFDRVVNLGDRLTVATNDVIMSSGSQFIKAAAKYDNSENAIGYALYHQLYIDGITGGNSATVKMFSVGGALPSKETIESGDYKLTEDIYVVIRKDALSGSPERVLYNWICSRQGSEVIANENYTIVQQ